MMESPNQKNRFIGRCEYSRKAGCWEGEGLTQVPLRGMMRGELLFFLRFECTFAGGDVEEEFLLLKEMKLICGGVRKVF